MTKQDAREILGLATYDTPLKGALEEFKQAELRLAEVTLNPSEKHHIKLTIKAIDTLLRLKDYDVE